MSYKTICISKRGYEGRKCIYPPVCTRGRRPRACTLKFYNRIWNRDKFMVSTMLRSLKLIDMFVGDALEAQKKKRREARKQTAQRN